MIFETKPAIKWILSNDIEERNTSIAPLALGERASAVYGFQFNEATPPQIHVDKQSNLFGERKIYHGTTLYIEGRARKS